MQLDEGVVAVQGRQQHVHPLQRGSDTERDRQAPESGLREEASTLKTGDQKTFSMILQLAVDPLRWRLLS